MMYLVPVLSLNLVWNLSSEEWDVYPYDFTSRGHIFFPFFIRKSISIVLLESFLSVFE